MAAPLGGAGDHRQHRRGPLQRLDLRLLVDREDRRVRRRGQVQARDVADLVDEQRIGGDLEVLGPPGLQPEGPPDPVHGRRGDADPFSQLPLGPVRGALGDFFQGAHDHLFHLGVGDGARYSRAGSSPSPSSRLARNRARHLVTVVRLTRSRAATAMLLWPSAQARMIRAPQCQPLRGLAPLRPVLQCPPLVPGQHQRRQPAITHASSRPRANGPVTTRPGIRYETRLTWRRGNSRPEH